MFDAVGSPHHFPNHEVELLVGQGVVLTTKVSHDVQTGLGGDTGGPVDLPAGTHTHTRLLVQCKTVTQGHKEPWGVSLMSGTKSNFLT